MILRGSPAIDWETLHMEGEITKVRQFQIGEGVNPPVPPPAPLRLRVFRVNQTRKAPHCCGAPSFLTLNPAPSPMETNP